MSIDRFRKHSIPLHAHPLVRKLFAEMNSQEFSITKLQDRTGIKKDTIMRWRSKNTPRIGDLEACFNVLGKTLYIGNMGRGENDDE
ncbi:MAG: hypothetical protein RIQ99_474 [Pseudomonadota bacterium]